MFEGIIKGISMMFQGSFKGVSRKIEGCSKRPSRVIQGRFKGIKKKFKGYLREFQGSFLVSRVFKNISMEFCFCNFVIAWISSQLPEQEEGLLKKYFG